MNYTFFPCRRNNGHRYVKRTGRCIGKRIFSGCDIYKGRAFRSVNIYGFGDFTLKFFLKRRIHLRSRNRSSSNSLKHSILYILTNFICVRICANIHCGNRIDRLFGDHKAVKSLHRLNRFHIGKDSCGRRKVIDKYRIRSIPLSIIKIIINLGSAFPFLIIAFFLSVHDS